MISQIIDYKGKKSRSEDQLPLFDELTNICNKYDVELKMAFQVVSETDKELFDKARNFTTYKNEYSLSFHQINECGLLILHTGNNWMKEYFKQSSTNNVPTILYSGGNRDEYGPWINQAIGRSCVFVSRDELNTNFEEFISSWKDFHFSTENIPFNILESGDKKKSRVLSDKLLGLSYLIQGALVMIGHRKKNVAYWCEKEMGKKVQVSVDEKKCEVQYKTLMENPCKWFKPCVKDINDLFQDIDSPRSFNEKHIAEFSNFGNSNMIFSSLLTNKAKIMKWRPLLRVAKAVSDCCGARSEKSESNAGSLSYHGKLKKIMENPKILKDAYENYNELLKTVEEICGQ